MNASLLATAAITTAFWGASRAVAVDSQMIGLIMPDAKVIGGINAEKV